MAKRERPEVPEEMVERVRAITDTLPEVYEEDAWVGLRWRVGGATVAHLFGGEDQQFRIVLHGQSGDVAAFEHLGHPYFRAGWGADVIGLVLEDSTDWEEVRELIIESFCLLAPKRLVDQLGLPPQPEVGTSTAP